MIRSVIHGVKTPASRSGQSRSARPGRLSRHWRAAWFALALILAVAESGRVAAQSSDSGELEFRKFGGIQYSSGEEYRLTLDAYVPAGEGPFPAILAVHGGSWRSGTKLNWVRHARKLAGAGFVVVAINYRHAPQFQFPAQIHDCKAAVRWMRLNAHEYQIDPNRIGGLGYSAGGQLVALLGVTGPEKELEGAVRPCGPAISTRLQAVGVGGAPCDFTWIVVDSQSLNYWLGGTRREQPEIWRQATPTTWLAPDDPPFYLFHGRNDWIVPYSSAESFLDQLHKAGIEAELESWDNGHFGLFSRLEAMDPVIAFFRRTLRDEKQSASSRKPK